MNVLGASRMERDFSGIIGSVARGGKYGIRDLFARASQLCMLANMEEDEWEAVNADEGEGDENGDGEVMAWVLNEEERKWARGVCEDLRT